MKTIRITSGVEVDGKHCKEGTIIQNVDNALAAEIVTAGRAEIIPEKAKKIVIPDPVVQDRDPKPGKPARPAKGQVDAPPEA